MRNSKLKVGGLAILHFAFCLLPLPAQPVPATTAYTRYLLTSTNQAQAQTILGVTNGGGGGASITYNLGGSTNLNGDTGIQPGTIPMTQITPDFLAFIESQGASTNGGDVVAANNLTDLASLPQARTNLGANAAGNLTTGTVDPARLPSLPASKTTNFTATVGTLNALGATNVYGLGARNIKGRDAYKLWSTMQSNKPVRFLLLGDSVADTVETTRGIRRAFAQYMTNAGYGTYYTETADGGNDTILKFWASTPTSAGDDGYSIGRYFPTANAVVLTTAGEVANGIPANRATLYFHGGAALGSILVQTQLNGGSFGTLATVNASALPNQFIATNWTLPWGSYNLKFTSTGSNNLVNWGLTDTTATTNSVTWAKLTSNSTGGGSGTVDRMLTNAGFAVFLTNYNPTTIFIESKDPVVNADRAATWAAANLTNYDIVWITPSPTLPEPGAGLSGPEMREVIIASAQSNNNWAVFDKYAYFTPTNFWFSALPFAAGNIWTDGAHLSGKGIAYISSAFADWFGAGSDRFALAGLLPIGTGGPGSDATKANLAGGNTFTGTQIISDQLSLGAGAGMFHYDPTGGGGMRIGPTNAYDIIRYRSTYQSDKTMFVITNGLGTTNLYMATDPGYLMTLGANSPFKFIGNGVGLTGIPTNALDATAYAAFIGGGSWVGTATSLLDMNNFGITNLSWLSSTGTFYLGNLVSTNFYPGGTNSLLATAADGKSTNAVIGSGLTFSGNVLSATGVGDGSALTNLTYNLRTNAINTGVVPVGKTTFTNISGNITIAGFSGVDLNFNQFAKLWVTNSTASDYTVTLPAEVATATNAFVLAQAVWVTNKSAVTINFDLAAWGTNAAAVRFQR